MTAGSRFAAQVSDQVRMVQRRMEAVMKSSTLDVIERTQIDVEDGGNMPVVTGFLRASGQASFDGMPSGLPREGDQWDVEDVILEIERMEIGKTFYFGWTANYAIYMEDRYSFLYLATQKWQSIVDKNAQRAVREIK